MRLLLVSGSLRSGSINTSVLRALEAEPVEGVVATVFGGLGALPHFNPDDDHEPLPPAVIDLRREIAEADAVLFCTPEYAGDLPGSFKNALDWTVGGTEICDLPVGWINTSTAPGGALGAHAALRTVLRYTGAAIVDDACLDLPVARTAILADGTLADPAVQDRLDGVVRALVTATTRVGEG